MLVQNLIIAALAAPAAAKVAWAGVNIAGCDIGMDIDGNYRPENSYGGKYGCPTNMAADQMRHFKKTDGFNIFRIPVAWQSLVGNDLVNVKLDEKFMKTYDSILYDCLDQGNRCIVDIHNYARWWGKVINQGGPSGDKLAQTWSLLAKRYAKEKNVVFGLMNEPHGDTNNDASFDINNWAGVMQKCVNAIRKAGANDQWILLAGRVFANAGAFPSTSGDALKTIKNPSGGHDNLYFDVHQYFDPSGGAEPTCSQDNTGTFSSLGDYLRSIGRKAFIGEIGGGNNQGCADLICPALDVINKYSDVYLGWTSWAAGNWWPDYELIETPQNGKDRLIVSQCFGPKFKG